MSMIEVIDRPHTETMSDDQLADEKRAQEELYCAVRIMRKAIRLVNHMSSMETVSLNAWDDFVHDWIPGEKNWNDKIAEARRG